MPRNSSSNSSQNQSDSSNTSQNSSGSSGQQQTNSRTALYIGIAIVIVLVIAGLFLLFSSNINIPTTSSSIGSTNGTPVYMTSTQAQTLLGPLLNYSTYDLFDPTSFLNITLIESITPDAQYNVTEGWVTFAQGQNITSNATIEYFVMKGYNASSLADSLALSSSEFFATPPETSYGTQSGVSYTYEFYRNSTANFQIISGYKGNYTILAVLISNSSFTANQTSLIDIAADNVP